MGAVAILALFIGHIIKMRTMAHKARRKESMANVASGAVKSRMDTFMLFKLLFLSSVAGSTGLGDGFAEIYF